MLMVRGKFLAMDSVVFPSETSITWTFASYVNKFSNIDLIIWIIIELL
jgi:hypothetical protein